MCVCVCVCVCVAIAQVFDIGSRAILRQFSGHKKCVCVCLCVSVYMCVYVPLCLLLALDLPCLAGLEGGTEH